MLTELQTDKNGHKIPVLSLLPAGGHVIAAGGTTTRNSIAFREDTKVVSVFSTTDVFIKFGGDDVSATTGDHFFPAGIYYDFSLGGENTAGRFLHLAVLQANTSGSVYVSEKV